MFGRKVIKSPPCVGAVQWHPAEKEQDYNDHQHADDSLLGLKLGLRCVAAWPVCLERLARRSHGGHLHRVWTLDINVAAITVITATGHG